VLLVEDDAAVRDSLMKGLVNHGFDILEASTGDEALLVCQHCREIIEVAIIDMALPMMWGDELAHRLAIVSPSTKVIFISGHSEDFLRTGGALRGDEIFFAKPFAPKLLLQKVKELLGIEDPVVPVASNASSVTESNCPQTPQIAEQSGLQMETQ
jgi:DNA-binding response OmpR family regulator